MIAASDIYKRFGNVEVLKGASLSIAAGEIVALVGASGAGKTTLLQILGTLSRPDAGSVRYGDTDVFALRDAELSRFRNNHIGFVFQLHRLLPEFSLVENVAMPALIAGSTQAESRRRAMELLDYLGLSHRAGHRPAQLSGGEAQRGAVARALVNKPAVVLADEPTGSLDSQNRTELHRLFFDLRRDLGATFLIVTHDEHLAADCDRTVRMADGVICPDEFPITVQSPRK
ncbi:MAG: ABC transporter ATP-binding protein [Muribaculaceae bacterium]|nr:ABC transporter ATP-binding protein [Muribaculaceae bacterium]